MNQQKTALLSASVKNEALADFATRLIELDWTLLASSGTKKYLDQRGIASKDVASIVGEPILGHRVVTLSREVFAGILARPDNAEDMKELERIGVPPIQLVYVSFYPLAEELGTPNCTVESVTEKIDIGGPSLLRAVAKAGGYAVSNLSQFEEVVDFLRNPPADTPEGVIARQRFLARLATDAEDAVSVYTDLAGAFYQSIEDGMFPQKWRDTL